MGKWVVVHHCDIFPIHTIDKGNFQTLEEAQKWADFKMKNRGIKNVGKDGNDSDCCIYYVEYLEEVKRWK
jgi:hypothetical protein